jgi:hypothetical protein
VIAVDTNILVYSHRKDLPWHSAARRVVTKLAESGESWAIPWTCVHEFFAVVTNGRAFRNPTPRPAAIAQIEIWMESPALHLIGEGTNYWRHLTDVVATARVEGARVHDARIAAICREHAVEALWSADRDFTRFPELRVVNPLVGRKSVP